MGRKGGASRQANQQANQQGNQHKGPAQPVHSQSDGDLDLSAPPPAGEQLDVTTGEESAAAVVDDVHSSPNALSGSRRSEAGEAMSVLALDAEVHVLEQEQKGRYEAMVLEEALQSTLMFDVIRTAIEQLQDQQAIETDECAQRLALQTAIAVQLQQVSVRESEKEAWMDVSEDFDVATDDETRALKATSQQFAQSASAGANGLPVAASAQADALSNPQSEKKPLPSATNGARTFATANVPFQLRDVVDQLPTCLQYYLSHLDDVSGNQLALFVEGAIIAYESDTEGCQHPFGLGKATKEQQGTWAGKAQEMFGAVTENMFPNRADQLRADYKETTPLNVLAVIKHSDVEKSGSSANSEGFRYSLKRRVVAAVVRGFYEWAAEVIDGKRDIDRAISRETLRKLMTAMDSGVFCVLPPGGFSLTGHSRIDNPTLNTVYAVTKRAEAKNLASVAHFSPASM